MVGFIDLNQMKSGTKYFITFPLDDFFICSRGFQNDFTFYKLLHPDLDMWILQMRKPCGKTIEDRKKDQVVENFIYNRIYSRDFIFK